MFYHTAICTQAKKNCTRFNITQPVNLRGDKSDHEHYGCSRSATDGLPPFIKQCEINAAQHTAGENQCARMSD
jgi:hypothetical protein